MRSEVMYRDLPGGPLLVKFADEVSLWCLCSKCGMFSKDMFQDSASHVFCSVCVFKCNEQKMIHCKHERKDVPVDDMVPAVNVSQVMMDQIAFCPNRQSARGCKEFCSLKDLKVHYLQCAATEINCLSCGCVVNGLDWERHINTCRQEILQCRYCFVAVPKESLEGHEGLCHDNPEARREYKNATPVTDASFSSPNLLQRNGSKMNCNDVAVDGATLVGTKAASSTVDSEDSLLECIYCKRSVKRRNMEHHTKICTQNKNRAPVSTVESVPGNTDVTHNTRNTPLVTPNEPPQDATNLQDSSLKCEPLGFAEDSRNARTSSPSAIPRSVTASQKCPELCDQRSVASASGSTSVVRSNNPCEGAIAVTDSLTSCESYPETHSWTILNACADPQSTKTCSTPPEVQEMGEDALSSVRKLGGGIVDAMWTYIYVPIKENLPEPAKKTFNGIYQHAASFWSLGGHSEDHETSSQKCENAFLVEQTASQDSHTMLRCPSGSKPMQTRTAEGSAASSLEYSSSIRPCPDQPSQEEILKWFNYFETWLQRNGITTEQEIFPLLLNKIPEIFSGAILDLQHKPDAYSEAKRTILHNFEIKNTYNEDGL